MRRSGSRQPTAIELAERPCTMVIVGGRVRPVTMAGADRRATPMLRDIVPDLAIMDANGMGDHRWMTAPSPSVAAVKEAVLVAAQRSIFVGSHSRLGHRAVTRFGHVRQLELLITGRELGATTARHSRSPTGPLSPPPHPPSSHSPPPSSHSPTTRSSP